MGMGGYWVPMGMGTHCRTQCKVKVGKPTLTGQFLQGCLPYQPPTIWQTLTYQAGSVGSYNERCGTDNEISVKVGKHTLTRQPLQVAYPTNLPQFQPHQYVFP